MFFSLCICVKIVRKRKDYKTCFSLPKGKCMGALFRLGLSEGGEELGDCICIFWLLSFGKQRIVKGYKKGFTPNGNETEIYLYEENVLSTK